MSRWRLQNQGVENVFFNNFTIGADPDRFYQINNDFELSDNFSKVVGSHSIKVGAQLDYDQINTHPFADLNGSFNFYGTETGLDFADFLLGIAEPIHAERSATVLRPQQVRRPLRAG